jgi:hypothetical protein
VSVLVRNPTTASISVNNTQICLGGTSLLSATVTGGSTQRQYHWQSSPDGSIWTDIGVNNTNYTFNPSVLGVTQFRIRVSDPVLGCNQPFSNAVVVTVSEDAAVTISATQNEVCTNEPIVLSASVTGGSPALVYHWQSSADGFSGWTDVGVSNTNYSPPTGTAGLVYYRVRLVDTNPGCAQPNSSALSIRVFNDAAISINATATEVCVDGSSTLSATVTGGSTSINYHWQSSPDGVGNWTDIGASDAAYVVPTTVAGTYYFRARVEDPIAGCDDPVSNVITVIVNPDAQISAVVDNAEVCVGGVATLTATLTGGSSGASIQWQTSMTTGGPWTDIPGATISVYNAPTNGAGTTYYQVQVIDPNSDCATPTSNEVSVQVNPDATVSANVDNAEICIDGIATLTASLTGGSSAATLQWQNSSAFGGPFADISGATNTTYIAPSTIAGVTYYRVRVIDPGSDCSQPNSNVASVTVQPDAQVSANVNNAEVCVGGSALLTATVTGGSGALTLQWQNSAVAGGPYANITGATSNTYNAPTTGAGVTYYRMVVTDSNSDCSDPESNEVTVTVNPDAQVSIVVDNAQVCIGGTATLTATLTGGSSQVTLQWQNSSNAGGPFAAIPGATNTTFSAPTTVTGTTYYRVVVLDPLNGCATPNSNVTSVLVRPDATISAVVNNSQVCVGGSATLTATLTGGSTQATIQWQSGTSTTGPWTDIAGQTNAIYASPTGTAGTYYYHVIVIDPLNGCAQPVSATLTVLVNPLVTVSTAVDNGEICVGGTATLVATITGGSGSLTYHWQTSPDGLSGWVDVGVANGNLVLNPSLEGTYYYRVRIQDSVSGCLQPNSNSVSVIVNEDAQVSVSADNAEVCTDEPVNLTADITGGSVNLQYFWQSSPDGTSNWIDVGVGNSDYAPSTSVPGTFYYRVRIEDINGGCAEPNSAPVMVLVNQPAQVVADPTFDELCVGGTSILNASFTGGSASLSYEWQ